MKLTLALIAFFIDPCLGLADNWMRREDLVASNVRAFEMKADCESGGRYVCEKIDGKDIRAYRVKTTTSDDLTKPIFKPPYVIQLCPNELICNFMVEEVQADCFAGDTAKVSQDQAGQWSAYCTGIQGYEKKTERSFIYDVDLAEDLADQDETKFETEYLQGRVKQNIACGQNIRVLMNIRNLAKQFTVDQVLAYLEQTASVRQLIEAGALETARTELTRLEPDEVLITQEDKVFVDQELTKCLESAGAARPGG